MVDDTVRFVQFSHPGPEHRPALDTMPWNVGDHGRKFLRGSGRFVARDGHEDGSELVFWGEWEPPSRIEHRWPPDGGNPQVLHQPYWFRPAPGQPRQNTDPWVFGSQMLYSNCRQGIKSMRTLPVGSVICFGSTLHGEFVFDTMFVVASAQPWTPANTDQLDVDYAFTVCTAESITADGSARGGCGGPEPTGCEKSDHSLTLYRGATFQEPVHGMYSFVPALPITGDDPPRFPRPVIHLPGLINPEAWQTVRGPTNPRAISEVRDAWHRVRQQILDAGQVLAVQLHTPPREASDQTIPVPQHATC
jgi:hypothetical protein